MLAAPCPSCRGPGPAPRGAAYRNRAGACVPREDQSPYAIYTICHCRECEITHGCPQTLIRADVREWDGPAVLPPRTAQRMTGGVEARGAHRYVPYDRRYSRAH